MKNKVLFQPRFARQTTTVFSVKGYTIVYTQTENLTEDENLVFVKASVIGYESETHAVRNILLYGDKFNITHDITLGDLERGHFFTKDSAKLQDAIELLFEAVRVQGGEIVTSVLNHNNLKAV